MPFVEQKHKRRKIPFPWFKLISAITVTTFISYMLVFVYKLYWMVNNVHFCKDWKDYSIFSITSLDCFPCPPGVHCDLDDISGCINGDDIYVEHPLYFFKISRKIFVPVCVEKPPEPISWESHAYTVLAYVVAATVLFGIYQYYLYKKNTRKLIQTLAKQSIQMVKKHAALVDTTPDLVLPTGIDVTHLRDHFLFPKYKLKKRIEIWNDVSQIVTSNSNIAEQKVMFKNEWHLVWSYRSSISDNEMSDVEE
eukprot:NODE_44_length_28780_cov_0.148496.p11 type:complete len:251 gc:universal NODE_44_length_28780_cov_0.148496:17471-18223(+)